MIRIRPLAILVLVVAFLHSSGWAQQPKWHGKLLRIIALESSKSEVERIFRNPRVRRPVVENNINIVLYETAEGKFSVEYTNDPCSSKTAGLTVAKDTVLELVFFPTRKMPFSIFDIDRGDFKEVDEPHDPGSEFVSEELGITYSVQRNKVIFVRIHPKSLHAGRKCN